MKVEFGTRRTPRGCVAYQRTPKRFVEKQFIDGLLGAESKADNWILKQIDIIIECISAGRIVSDDVEVYIDGKLVNIMGESSDKNHGNP